MWGGEGVDGAEQRHPPPQIPLYNPKGLHQFLPSYKSTTAEPLTNKPTTSLLHQSVRLKKSPDFCAGCVKIEGSWGLVGWVVLLRVMVVVFVGVRGRRGELAGEAVNQEPSVNKNSERLLFVFLLSYNSTTNTHTPVASSLIAMVFKPPYKLLTTAKRWLGI